MSSYGSTPLHFAHHERLETILLRLSKTQRTLHRDLTYVLREMRIIAMAQPPKQ